MIILGLEQKPQQVAAWTFGPREPKAHAPPPQTWDVKRWQRPKQKLHHPAQDVGKDVGKENGTAHGLQTIDGARDKIFPT